MPEIRIYTGRRPICIDSSTLIDWFDNLPREIFYDYVLYPQNLALSIRCQVGRRVRISQASILKTICALFGIFQSKRTWGGIRSTEDTQLQIQGVLTKMLHEEARFMDFEGIKAPRHKFVVLCYFAREYGSELLAEALYRFISENIYNIARYEDPNYLHEWEMGVRRLRELIGENACAPLIYQLTPGRGRHLLRLEQFRPRAITAPPPRIRYRSASRLALPPQDWYTGWPSPVLNPEVEELRDRQEMLEHQVAELQNEVDGGMVGVGGFSPPLRSPRRIDW